MESRIFIRSFGSRLHAPIIAHLGLGGIDRMNPIRLEYAVPLECGKLDDQCCIFLPHRSLLGTYEYPQHPSTGTWNVMFLCLRHGLLFPRGDRDVHPEIYQMPGTAPIPPFWELEAQCAHENCGILHTIYTAGLEDFEKLKIRVLQINPIVLCEGHDLVWNKELIQGTQY